MMCRSGSLPCPTPTCTSERIWRKLVCRILSTENYDGAIALPELMDDLGAEGISSVMLEGGALTARKFLENQLVDRIALFQSDL